MKSLKANIVDLVQRRIYPARITIDAKRIHSIEELSETLDQYILPGFVDAHIHIESSMLEFELKP